MPQNSDPYYDERIIDVKNRHTSRLLALNNVHTVAIGHKVANGYVLPIPAIVVFTTHKRPLYEFPVNQRIPTVIEGFPTDVVELPNFVPHQLKDGIPNRERYRPVPGGAEIYMPNSPFAGGFCTLGMFVHSTRPQDNPEDIYLLSNAHCFYRNDQAIFQPESHESDNRIAYSSRIINSSRVDAGIAQMLDNDDAQPYEIIGIGTPLSPYTLTLANLSQTVVKSGRTTGVTIGRIAYLHANADDKRDQIIIADIDTAFSDHGDSGSIVLMESGEQRHHVVGLLWGGAEIYTILSPIEMVVEELEISLITA